MNEEIHWLPIELTPFELEWMARQEEFYRQLLAAFALTQEEIGTIQDMNRTYAERREAIYGKRLGTHG